MPVLFAEGRWRMSLVGPTPGDPIEGSAFKALRRQARALTQVDLPMDSGETEPAIVQLRVGKRWESGLPIAVGSISPAGFRIRVEPDAITLVGGTPKGTVNAAYELLERLGLRWPTTEPDGRSVERPATIELPECDDVVEPSFPGLTIFQDLRTLRDYDSDPGLAPIQQQNDRDLILWMGRLRFTGYYANNRHVVEPMTELTRRGIRRQSGGHILPRLLPRELYQDHPDYFPMNPAGERFPGNLCSSNEEAIRIVCDNALNELRQSGADLLHLWGEDAVFGKWCSCPDCESINVHDQYLRVVNAVADRLSEEQTGARVAYIAYHDTLSPKITGTPRPNVSLLFAPRQRCYRHPLADPNCERNTAIHAGLLEYARIFGPERVHTFEYYGDALLWCGASIVLPHLIVEDLRTYRAAGVTDSGCLMFGGFSWFSHPLNLYTFARASWNLDRSAEEIVAEFCQTLYPGAVEEMTRFYDRLEDAARRLVERSDWLYRIPVGDHAALRDLAQEADEIARMWEAMTEPLDRALVRGGPRAGEGLLRERQALRFSQHLVRAYRSAVEARAGSERTGNADGLLAEAAAEARLALQLLHDISPYLRGSWGMEGHGESLRLKRFIQECEA